MTTPTTLAESIRRCADVRGDSAAQVDALLIEAAELTSAQRAEMREHFDEQASVWRAATGREAA